MPALSCPKCGGSRVATTKTQGGFHVCAECGHRWQDAKQAAYTARRARRRVSPNQHEAFLASTSFTSADRQGWFAGELAAYREHICLRIETARAGTMSRETADVLDRLLDEIRGMHE